MLYSGLYIQRISHTHTYTSLISSPSVIILIYISIFVGKHSFYQSIICREL